jgi:hypothetical protein
VKRGLEETCLIISNIDQGFMKLSKCLLAKESHTARLPEQIRDQSNEASKKVVHACLKGIRKTFFVVLEMTNIKLVADFSQTRTF